jgi:hypothetical protein
MQRGNRRHLWSGTPDCPVCHRTSVRCTTGHVRCTRGLQLELATFGNFQRPLRYNSPDCPVCTGHVRCSKEGRPQELGSLGFSFQPLRYNSPDCPVHLRSNGYLRRHLMRAQRAQSQARPCWRTGHSTVRVRCATGHQGGPRSQNSNGRFPTALVTWRGHRTVRCAPDCPVCTGLSGAPSNRQPSQRSCLVVEAINTPTTPPFIASKFFTSQLLQEL